MLRVINKNLINKVKYNKMKKLSLTKDTTITNIIHDLDEYKNNEQTLKYCEKYKHNDIISKNIYKDEDLCKSIFDKENKKAYNLYKENHFDK